MNPGALRAAIAECREGKQLSADTLATLQQVLDLVAGADDNVDEAQVVLSQLMGVPNPDQPEPRAAMIGPERRVYSAGGPMLLRARTDQSLRFKGHAAVFNERTWIGPPRVGFWEEVSPGAFSRAVNEDDVRFLFNHDESKVLARTAAGTLALREDRSGLVVEADMAQTSYAADLAVLLERGDVSQMSFGFAVSKDTWSTLDDGSELRTIEQVAPLYDVSAVTFPAYEGTDAALRACEVRRAGSREARFRALKMRLDAAYGLEKTHD